MKFILKMSHECLNMQKIYTPIHVFPKNIQVIGKTFKRFKLKYIKNKFRNSMIHRKKYNNKRIRIEHTNSANSHIELRFTQIQSTTFLTVSLLSSNVGSDKTSLTLYPESSYLCTKTFRGSSFIRIGLET